jgi:predicted regulator of Ras-like GTPase activity (Roadblock/LC7/MglB family)
MFLFSRFKDVFSKDYWLKSKKHSIGSSIGFFTFWMVLISLVASIALVVSFNIFVKEGIDDFRRDFVDFEVKMEDGVLSTRNIPDPFVLNEFLDSENASSMFGLDEEMIDEFKAGFTEELVIEGQQFEIDDIEVVIDTDNQLGLTADNLDMQKIGFYFLSDQFIVTDPTATVESEMLAIESYENIDDFLFDKEYIIGQWDKYSTTIFLILFGFCFSFLVGMLLLVRFITALWWALVVWALGSMFNFKFDYFEAYGIALVYLVPITIIELALLWVMWIPMTTVGLIIGLSVYHQMAVSTPLKVIKPEVINPKAIEKK